MLPSDIHQRDTDMEDPRVLTEPEAFELVAHLVSSADTSLFEPRRYPPFRLLDAAGRLATIAADRVDGELRTFWAELAADIAANQDLMMWDPAGFEAFIRETTVRIVDEQRRRNDR